MITTLAILALLALLGSGVVFATSIVIGGVGSFVLAYSLAVLGITLIFFTGVIERLDKIVAALRQDASTRTPAEPKPASAIDHEQRWSDAMARTRGERTDDHLTHLQAREALARLGQRRAES